MNVRSTSAAILSVLFLALLACGPVTITATPTPPPATKTPFTPSPTPEPTVAPTGTRPAATLEVFPPAASSFDPGDPLALDEIHMATVTEGWGLSGAHVLVTDDGGRTWREVTPPAGLEGEAPEAAFAAFLDPQTAWVIFGSANGISPQARVWLTADGGATWGRSAPLQHEAYGDRVWAEFAALDASQAWLMVRGVFVGAGTHYVTHFFRTADGGQTWTTLPGDVGVDYSGLAFADPATGWLAWETTGAYYNWPPEYAFTADGGLSWESRDLPPPSDAPGLFDELPYCEPYRPIPLPEGGLWLLMACFDYHFPPEEFTSYLYASPDGGLTWEALPLPEPVLASAATLLRFDVTHALLLGRENYRSADGGRTWVHLSTVYWDGQFSFVDPLHGWAVARMEGEVGLVQTTDGGVRWTLLHPEIAE